MLKTETRTHNKGLSAMLASENILIDTSLPDSYRVSRSLPAGRQVQLNARPNVTFVTGGNIPSFGTCLPAGRYTISFLSLISPAVGGIPG